MFPSVDNFNVRHHLYLSLRVLQCASWVASDIIPQKPGDPDHSKVTRKSHATEVSDYVTEIVSRNTNFVCIVLVLCIVSKTCVHVCFILPHISLLSFITGSYCKWHLASTLIP